MNNEKDITTTCKTCRSHMADLLLDSTYAASQPELSSHLRSCANCQTELSDLHTTFLLLDEFEAPEPSAYFDSKLHARLREAQAESEGFWERMRSSLLFSTGRSFRPALAGALATLLIVGGAGLAGLHNYTSSSTVQASSTVNDLKVLDNNESAEQQLGQLLDMSGSEDGDDQPTT